MKPAVRRQYTDHTDYNELTLTFICVLLLSTLTQVMKPAVRRQYTDHTDYNDLHWPLFVFSFCPHWHRLWSQQYGDSTQIIQTIMTYTDLYLCSPSVHTDTGYEASSRETVHRSYTDLYLCSPSADTDTYYATSSRETVHRSYRRWRGRRRLLWRRRWPVCPTRPGVIISMVRLMAGSVVTIIMVYTCKRKTYFQDTWSHPIGTCSVSDVQGENLHGPVNGWVRRHDYHGLNL